MTFEEPPEDLDHERDSMLKHQQDEDDQDEDVHGEDQNEEDRLDDFISHDPSSLHAEPGQDD